MFPSCVVTKYLVTLVNSCIAEQILILRPRLLKFVFNSFDLRQVKPFFGFLGFLVIFIMVCWLCFRINYNRFLSFNMITFTRVSVLLSGTKFSWQLSLLFSSAGPYESN